MSERIGSSLPSRAAAAVLLAALAGAGVWLLGSRSAGIALADVQARIGQANTVCFRMTYQQGSGERLSCDVLYRRPNLMRMERPEMIGIMHTGSGHMLMLETQGRTAISGKVSDYWDETGNQDWVVELERVAGSDKAQDLGQRLIEGRQAKGWRVVEDKWITTVWADVENAQLLEAQLQHGQSHVSLQAFVYDRELDEGLFSFDPPPGYSLQAHSEMSANDPTEKDLLGLLRIWANGNGEVFPDNLNPWEFGKAASKANWPVVCPNQTYQQASDMISRAFVMLNAWPRDWTYVGKGVRFGDAQRAVFCYRPKAADKYRVIFGDLSVKQMAEQDLPR